MTVAYSLNKKTAPKRSGFLCYTNENQKSFSSVNCR